MFVYSDILDAKVNQEYSDFIEMTCIEEFPNQLTIGKTYRGYLIKKHNNKDGVRIITQNDMGKKEDYPIRWFKLKEG